jgi:hypothetical protein
LRGRFYKNIAELYFYNVPRYFNFYINCYHVGVIFLYILLYMKSPYCKANKKLKPILGKKPKLLKTLGLSFLYQYQYQDQSQPMDIDSNSDDDKMDID